MIPVAILEAATYFLSGACCAVSFYTGQRLPRNNRRPKK